MYVRHWKDFTKRFQCPSFLSFPHKNFASTWHRWIVSAIFVQSFVTTARSLPKRGHCSTGESDAPLQIAPRISTEQSLFGKPWEKLQSPFIRVLFYQIILSQKSVTEVCTQNKLAKFRKVFKNTSLTRCVREAILHQIGCFCKHCVNIV